MQGLSLSWDGRPVVADVSLEVRPGRLACLVGRSGTGKTTLFHAIAGLTAPDAGRILLDGRDVTGRPGSIGYMLQKDLLLPIPYNERILNPEGLYQNPGYGGD